MAIGSLGPQRCEMFSPKVEQLAVHKGMDMSIEGAREMAEWVNATNARQRGLSNAMISGCSTDFAGAIFLLQPLTTASGR